MAYLLLKLRRSLMIHFSSSSTILTILILKSDTFIIVGQSERGRLLIVLYTERNQKIRLISAREATRLEKIAYEEG
jgi:uncharacterized DUF497 family protein